MTAWSVIFVSAGWLSRWRSGGNRTAGWHNPAGDRFSGFLTCVGLPGTVELGKTLDRHLFVGVHLKDFVQLSDLHHAMYVFRRIQKL